jgi:hypothetical protein
VITIKKVFAEDNPHVAWVIQQANVGAFYKLTDAPLRLAFQSVWRRFRAPQIKWS